MLKKLQLVCKPAFMFSDSVENRAENGTRCVGHVNISSTVLINVKSF